MNSGGDHRNFCLCKQHMHKWNTHNLFKHSHEHGQLVEINSIAFSGPLQTSSLLHLSINHLNEATQPRNVLILTKDSSKLQHDLTREMDLSLMGTNRSAKLIRNLTQIEIK